MRPKNFDKLSVNIDHVYCIGLRVLGELSTPVFLYPWGEKDKRIFVEGEKNIGTPKLRNDF